MQNKLLTFTWSVSIEFPSTFDLKNPADYDAALNEAWSQVQRGDGELTDEKEGDYDSSPSI